MTDDLDELKSLMRDATPSPDAARRAENLAIAQKNFQTLQGSPIEARPKTRSIWNGVRNMFGSLTSRGGLTATTALVACGFMFTPMGQELWKNTQTLAPELGGLSAQVSEDTVFRQNEEILGVSPAKTRSNNDATQTNGQSDLGVTIQQRSADRVQLDDDGIFFDVTVPAPQIALEAEAMDQSFAADMSVSPALNAAPMAEAIVMTDDIALLPEANSESFPQASDNPLKITSETPVSTFSIDVDTASYSFVRRSILQGQLPPRDAVRVEEMVNYFPYNYAAPEPDAAPFQPTLSTMQTPWNSDTQLVHIALQGELPAIEARPPLNLVFLIDTSGSMDAPDKLPLLRQSFMLMLDELRPEDEVSIVTYAGSAGRVLEPTPASNKGAIIAALAQLRAGGGTNGQGGLEQAYATADEMAEDGEVSRVILATDGDFNVGVSDPEGLTRYVEKKRESGTYLSVLGFGRGNLDDTTMQALAQNGNGTAAYIDTLAEARKVLVDQLTGALFTIAGDVKIQVEWNPAQIAEYRLIGFETRALNREDFNNDAVDAGELGAGHSVSAIYEVTPVGSPAQLSDPLRYQAETVAETSDELGFLRLRYKEPGDAVSQLIETPITSAETATNDAQFAVAVAGFGQLLRGNSFLGDWSYADAAALAEENRGDDPFGYRAEAIQLMQLAGALADQ